VATLRKRDWLALGGMGVLLCCGGGTMLGIDSLKDAPAPAVTTAAPVQRLADLPATATPTPTPTEDLVAVEASRSAAAAASASAKAEAEAEALAQQEEKDRAAEAKAKEEQAERARKKQEEQEAAEADDDEDSGSVYYKNCTAVRAAGADPIRRGDPGYAKHLDRDGDGVGCE
jgi:hypothetical protein